MSSRNSIAVSNSPRDYRLSHLAPGKSESYHRTFSKNPYRNMIWEFEKEVLNFIHRAYIKDQGFTHLDFACGTGRILAYFGGIARESVGIDVSSSMLDVARKNLIGVELIEADITKRDVLGDRKFDLITAFRFFPNAQAELRESAMRTLVRHLDKNGWLVFNNHRNINSLEYKLARLRRRGGMEGMSSAEVCDLLTQNGLEIFREFSLGFTPANEDHTFIPILLLRKIERVLSKLAVLKDLAKNKIFLCRRIEIEKCP